MFSHLKTLDKGTQYGFFGNYYSQVEEVLRKIGVWAVARCTSHTTKGVTDKYVLFKKVADGTWAIKAESIKVEAINCVLEEEMEKAEIASYN